MHYACAGLFFASTKKARRPSRDVGAPLGLIFALLRGFELLKLLKLFKAVQRLFVQRAALYCAAARPISRLRCVAGCAFKRFLGLGVGRCRLADIAFVRRLFRLLGFCSRRLLRFLRFRHDRRFRRNVRRLQALARRCFFVSSIRVARCQRSPESLVSHQRFRHMRVRCWAIGVSRISRFLS